MHHAFYETLWQTRRNVPLMEGIIHPIRGLGLNDYTYNTLINSMSFGLGDTAGYTNAVLQEFIYPIWQKDLYKYLPVYWEREKIDDIFLNWGTSCALDMYYFTANHPLKNEPYDLTGVKEIRSNAF